MIKTLSKCAVAEDVVFVARSAELCFGGTAYEQITRYVFFRARYMGVIADGFSFFVEVFKYKGGLLGNNAACCKCFDIGIGIAASTLFRAFNDVGGAARGNLEIFVF